MKDTVKLIERKLDKKHQTGIEKQLSKIITEKIPGKVDENMAHE